MEKNLLLELYSTYDCESLVLSKTLYEFDKQLKLIILNILFDIEQNIKYIFSINFINRYKDDINELINEKNYSNNKMVPEIISRTKKQLNGFMSTF